MNNDEYAGELSGPKITRPCLIAFLKLATNTKVLVMLSLLILGTSAQAQGVAVQGVGTFSCGKYLEFRATKNETQDAAFVSWVWGFLAGLNMDAPRATTQNLPDAASTLAYIDKHCGESPLNNVLQAANDLFKELGGRRDTSEG